MNRNKEILPNDKNKTKFSYFSKFSSNSVKNRRQSIAPIYKDGTNSHKKYFE